MSVYIISGQKNQHIRKNILFNKQQCFLWLCILSIARLLADPTRRKLWCHKIRRNDWELSVHSRICSDHFFEKYITRTGQRVELKGDAVPTRFKMFPTYFKKVTNVKVLHYYFLNILLVHQHLNLNLPSDTLETLNFDKIQHSIGTRGNTLGLLSLSKFNTN